MPVTWQFGCSSAVTSTSAIPSYVGVRLMDDTKLNGPNTGTAARVENALGLFTKRSAVQLRVKSHEQQVVLEICKNSAFVSRCS